MRIGIQILAYNCHDRIDRLLEPWRQAKKLLDLKIWVGSGQFKLYKDLGFPDRNQKTLERIQNEFSDVVDFLWTPGNDGHTSDQGTRSESLTWFKEQNIDLLWVVDSDEFYTKDDIFEVLKWVLSNDHFNWYEMSFKNLVGNCTSYLDFNVGRLAWFQRDGGVSSFYFDCHFLIGETDYRSYPGGIIPTSVAQPLHYTWTNSLNSGVSSQDKILYQNHFYSDGCGYVTKENGTIDFNVDFFSQKGMPVPATKKLTSLVFSTARRFHLFKRTLNSLIFHNPSLPNEIDSIYILDDRSQWKEREQMFSDISEIFGKNRVQLVTFDNDEEFAFVEKLNWLHKIDSEFILYLEDDWESLSPLNLEIHVQTLLEGKFDLISFSEYFDLQVDEIKNEIDVDINYFRNPFPSYLRHFLYYFGYEGQNDFIFPLADRAWKDGIFKNFSLNPSLYRTQIFKNCKFQRDLEFELKFGQQNNFKQIYTKWPRFFHIGNKESLGTGKN